MREAKGISQQDVADTLGISQKTYSNYESCKSSPSIEKLCGLSKILEFDIVGHLEELGATSPKNPQITSMKPAPHDPHILLHLVKNYELIIKDKEEIIKLLKEQIQRLENSGFQ